MFIVFLIRRTDCHKSCAKYIHAESRVAQSELQGRLSFGIKHTHCKFLGEHKNVRICFGYRYLRNNSTYVMLLLLHYMAVEYYWQIKPPAWCYIIFQFAIQMKMDCYTKIVFCYTKIFLYSKIAIQYFGTKSLTVHVHVHGSIH